MTPSASDRNNNIATGQTAGRDAPVQKQWLKRGSGLGFVLVGLTSIAELWWQGLPAWGEAGPGPAFFPGLLAAGLAILGLLLASGLGTATEPDDDLDQGQENPGPAPMLKFTALLVGLIICFPYLGGVLTFGLFVILEMLWVERSSLLSAVLAGIGALLLIWVIFIQILAVPLPPGLLEFIG